jgi:hypothetical protein
MLTVKQWWWIYCWGLIRLHASYGAVFKLFLGTLKKKKKKKTTHTTTTTTNIGFIILSVCLCGTTLLLPLDRFSFNLVFEYFQKSVEKIQVSLRSYENNEYFTWRPIYICDHIISPSSSWDEKCVGQVYRENQNTLFMFSNFFSKIVLFIIQCGKI